MIARCTEKPRCTLPREASVFSLLFRVRDALRAVGQIEEILEFLKRAEHCRTSDDVIRLAADYVVVE